MRLPYHGVLIYYDGADAIGSTTAIVLCGLGGFCRWGFRWGINLGFLTGYRLERYPLLGALRQSPGTVETSVVVMLNRLLILWSACAGVGRLGLPAFPASRGRRGSGVKGTPKACRALARCEAPLRPEGRPRILRGLRKISGGAAASVVLGGPSWSCGVRAGLGELVVDRAEHAARGM